MKRVLISTIGILILSLTTVAQKDPTAAAQLKLGDTAPDFTLSDTNGQKVKLSELRSKHNVVLAFYIFAFTGG
jgi:cytochrome oxidase Cu insertion factor (SCO1/SenC/PrrC family)